MYNATYWLDRVVDEETEEVIQEGTDQSAGHFNNMEEGISDAHLATAILLISASLSADQVATEEQTITLENSESFPFNNSVETVALNTARNFTDYTVEVRSHGDHFSPYPVDPTEPALETDRTRDGVGLVTAGHERARAWRLAGTDRVAVLADPEAPPTLLGEALSALWAVLVTGSPLVLSPYDTDALTGRLSTERVTTVLATEDVSVPEGVRPLS